VVIFVDMASDKPTDVPEWTPGQQRILDLVAQDMGREYAERILAEARQVEGADLEHLAAEEQE
jgi:hypothetical protein